MNFILREYNFNKISIRPDNYISATEMCRAVGKRWPDYNRLDSTKAYYKALSSAVQIPTALLIHTVEGGLSSEQGTWIHPKAAIHLAQWLSPEFAVQVTDWVFELLTKGVVDVRGKALHTNSGKLLTWDGFASEDALSEMIYSFVSGICGYRFLEREKPFLNTIADNPKTRRLDFITRFNKVVMGHELKLGKITVEDVEETLDEKGYLQILSNFIAELDDSKNRKVRPVKFVLLSPRGIKDDAAKLLESIPEVSFMSVQKYCWNHLNKAWYKKYSTQQYYFAGLVVNKYSQLFTPNTLEYLSNWLNQPKLLLA